MLHLLLHGTDDVGVAVAQTRDGGAPRAVQIALAGGVLEIAAAAAEGQGRECRAATRAPRSRRYPPAMKAGGSSRRAIGLPTMWLRPMTTAFIPDGSIP